MPSALDHPDNILGTGLLPTHLEQSLAEAGIRFVAKLQTANGHTFLLCGRRSPHEAGCDMLRDALRARHCVAGEFVLAS